MLSKTSLSALRALSFVAQQECAAEAYWSPRRIAETLGESPTYLAKVLRHLVKAGILRAEKGVKGGVRLALPVERISLLAVVEACQGTIIGDYCSAAGAGDITSFCAFHQAALELHQAITGVLGKWTLADLLKKPYHDGPVTIGVPCLMGCRESEAGL